MDEEMEIMHFFLDLLKKEQKEFTVPENEQIRIYNTILEVKNGTFEETNRF